MSLRIVVWAESEAIEESLILTLSKIVGGRVPVLWERRHLERPSNHLREPGSVLMIDARLPNLKEKLAEAIHALNPVVLIGEEPVVAAVLEFHGSAGDPKPTLIDDVVVLPVRPVELVAKLKLLQELCVLREAVQVSASLGELVEKFREDLSLAERLQKLHSRGLSTQMGEFSVTSRYVSGIEPGGDSFEILQPKGSPHLACLLTHSSTYGLRSRVNSFVNKEILPFFLKEDSFQLDSGEGVVTGMVNRWREELKVLLRDSEFLSLFIAVVDQRQNQIGTVSFGHSLVYLAGPSGEFEAVSPQSAVLSRAMEAEASPIQLSIRPFGGQGRLAVFSPGIKRLLGKDKVADLMSAGRKLDPLDLSTELFYLLRLASLSQNGSTHGSSSEPKFNAAGEDLQTEGEVPLQDCSALIIERQFKVGKINS